MNNSSVDYSVSGVYSYLLISYMVVDAVTFLLGITGNGLVIWFSIFRMKKTVSLVWFLSLAVADFTFALFLPLHITFFALDHWPFGRFMCKLNLFIYYFNKPISSLQLAVLSVDRCVRVAFPQWCHNHRTRRLALIIVLIIWILSSASCVIFFITNDTINFNSRVSCSYSITWNVYKLNVINRSVFLFFIPFTVIVCSYIGITLYSLRKHLPLCSTSFTVALTVSMTFLVCCSPYYMFDILMISNPGSYFYKAKALQIATFIRIISCCLNPVIYILIGWEIKGPFCSSLQAMLEKAFAEDDVYIGFSNRQDRTVSLNLEGLSEEQRLSVSR